MNGDMDTRLASQRSQSAMEYLMTYGWAILIIAVILGALYQVGVFNPYTFSPKAAAGSCKIARGIVDGQVTSSKVGTCNNALPQYVFESAQYSQVLTPALPIEISNDLQHDTTISAWLYINDAANTANALPYFSFRTPSYRLVFEQGPNGWYTGTSYACELNGWGDGEVAAVSSYQWYNIVERVTGETVYTYVNGVDTANSVAPASDQTPFVNPTVYIGGAYTAYGWQYFQGMISNVQVYNMSLTDNEIVAIYKEGIGGAPIDIKNLTGWWPLNGDTKDYSGNGNDGTPTNVVFTGSWTAGYSAP